MKKRVRDYITCTCGDCQNYFGEDGLGEHYREGSNYCSGYGCEINENIINKCEEDCYFFPYDSIRD